MLPSTSTASPVATRASRNSPARRTWPPACERMTSSLIALPVGAELDAAAEAAWRLAGGRGGADAFALAFVQGLRGGWNGGLGRWASPGRATGMARGGSWTGRRARRGSGRCVRGAESAAWGLGSSECSSVVWAEARCPRRAAVRPGRSRPRPAVRAGAPAGPALTGRAAAAGCRAGFGLAVPVTDVASAPGPRRRWTALRKSA